MGYSSRITSLSLLGASMLVAAGAATIAMSDQGLFAPTIKDIQIGERGMQTRIALFCEPACAPIDLGDGEFFLRGAGDRFDLDISGASERLQRLTAFRRDEGAAIRVGYDGALDQSTVKNCTVRGRAAACIDMFFAAAPAAKPARTILPPAPDLKTPVIADAGPATATQAAASAAAPTLREPAIADASATAAVGPAPSAPPPLRDDTAATAVRLAATEDTPALRGVETPILAKVQPIESAIQVSTPSLRRSEPLAPPMEASFAGRIETILGKTLTPAYCNNAEATLQADAWALGAMVDVGLCAAVRGDAVEAESILSRLLEYTPDNYEALVGRAIIAEQAGERGAALRYYQDALNAPPPMQESARIVEAMAALG